MQRARPVVLTLLGTRPEAIKLAPVVHAIQARSERIGHVLALTGQHADLAHRLVSLFGLKIDHDLAIGRPGQTPLAAGQRMLEALAPVLEASRPDLVLVQGDTTTALMGALAAFYSGIPVGHVEAGLRTDDPHNPFPEEMNRRLITRLADLHFAATPRNRDVLLAEAVPAEQIHVTGNPVIDALHWVLANVRPSAELEGLLARLDGRKLIALTTHRRESFGDVMAGNLAALRRFVEAHDEIELAFPVHPNPNVRAVTERLLSGHERIHLLEPLDYPDFTHLMSKSWLVCSDSGGVQEEVPSLGIPLLVLRRNTERPEAIESGAARLVDGDADVLETMLEDVWQNGSWVDPQAPVANPFGDGRAGEKIADAIEDFFQKEPGRLPGRPRGRHGTAGRRLDP